MNSPESNPESVKDILDYALKQDSSLTCSELTCMVKVRHHDGSLFILQNAKTEEKGAWLIIYAEHVLPQVFCKDDLEDVEVINPETKEEHWHYQAYQNEEGTVEVYEDYLDNQGNREYRTEGPVSPMGESRKELITDLEHMLTDALLYPVKKLDTGSSA
ncbi:MAG: hypothetical protein ACLFR1_01475 [Spirochaetia bacterium]